VRYYIVDVFAESKLSGNQLTVSRDSGRLSTSEMQQGYEVGRKSLILLKARKVNRKVEVDVGGRVQYIADGEFSGFSGAFQGLAV
jgi:predicted PhzF superfamily epimerase YddE/YHI9